MPISPTFNAGQTQPVDKLLGTAYPVVKAVYDKLIPIQYLVDNIDGLTAQSLQHRDAAAASALAASLSATATEEDKLASQAAASSTQENANLAEASRLNSEESEQLSTGWANLTGAAVTPGLYSAKEWATGTFLRGVANAGSAKDWANFTSGTVDGTEYSAKYYALESAARVTDAEAVLDDVEAVLTAAQGVLAAQVNLYYGSRALDPVTRPDGSAMQIADRYFSTSSNTEKVYNGAAWVIPNVGAADLAINNDAAKGSALVGHEGGTVRSVLLAHQGFIDTLNAGTTADAGTLTDADRSFLSRGTGVLDTPLSDLAAYVLAKQQIPGVARVSGLRATMVTNLLTATAARVIAMNSSGMVVVGAPGTTTCDVTLAGPVVGGRDQAAAFTANSWVHFHYITNGAAWGIIASASATAPTMPSGYNYGAYLGTIRKEATNMRDMRIFGSRAHFTVPNSLVVNGTATTLTDLSATVAQVIPVEASCYDIHCTFRLTADGSGIVDGQAYIYDTNTAPSIMVGRLGLQGMAASVQAEASPMTFTKVNNQQLWYQMMVANGTTQKLTIEVNHYVLPNGDN